MVDRQDPVAMVAPGWYQVIRTVDPGLDPLDETGVLVPADGITGRTRHAGQGAGNDVPGPARWSWPEPPAGWTPHADGSRRAPARTGALRAAEVTNG